MTETINALDAYGDPILLAVVPGGPRTDKTGSSIAVTVKSGNPFRDPGSGTFGNGPGGAKVTGPGADALKQLTPAAALYLTQMRNKYGATEIQVTVVNGRARIVMLKAGAQVATLDLPVPTQTAAQKGPSAPALPGAAQPAVTRDQAVVAARSDTGIEKLDGSARAQRVNDLVDYLYARYNASGAIFSKPGSVRVEAPAGWDKKTIGGLTDAELKDVAQRLSTMSWSTDALKKVLLPNIKASRRDAIITTPKENKTT